MGSHAEANSYLDELNGVVRPLATAAPTGDLAMTNKKTSPVVDIERMADEAEAGYDLTTLRPEAADRRWAPAPPK